MIYIQGLQKPFIVVRLVQNFVGLELPPLQDSFYYGFVEQINFDTINFAVGDIVLFQAQISNPSFFNNNIQYFVVKK